MKCCTTDRREEGKERKKGKEGKKGRRGGGGMVSYKVDARVRVCIGGSRQKPKSQQPKAKGKTNFILPTYIVKHFHELCKVDLTVVQFHHIVVPRHSWEDQTHT